MNDGPLSDLTVVELANDVAGAYAGKSLADLGARVVKVEPLTGDPLRRIGPFSGRTSHPERGALWLWLNTSKESVALDLNSDSGLTLLGRLLNRADALLISPAVEQLASLGWAPQTISARFPSLVVAAISPFGMTGRHSTWRADDRVRSAVSGWMFMSGRPDREPLATFDSLPSAVTGLAAASAVLMGMEARRHVGTGQVVDVSSQEVLALCTAYISLSFSCTGVERPRNGMPFPMTIVPAADGYLGINVLTQAQWEALCSFTGMVDLLDNPDFSTPLGRSGNAASLTQRFAEWAETKTRTEVFHDGQQWRIPFGFVPELSELTSLETHVERRFFQLLNHPEAGEAMYPRPPFVMRSPIEMRPAPLFNQHDAYVQAILEESDGPDRNLDGR